MIPLIFCGQDYRDWPWWAFWKRGHREHEHTVQERSPGGWTFPQLAYCPGQESR